MSIKKKLENYLEAVPLLYNFFLVLFTQLRTFLRWFEMRPFSTYLIRNYLVNLSETVRHVEKTNNVLYAHHWQLPCSVQNAMRLLNRFPSWRYTVLICKEQDFVVFFSCSLSLFKRVRENISVTKVIRKMNTAGAIALLLVKWGARGSAENFALKCGAYSS